MKHVHSTTEAVHLQRMATLIEERELRVVAELGTHIGGSILRFAEALQRIGGGHIHAIDNEEHLLKATRKNFDDNADEIPDVELTLYEGTCPEAIEMLPDGIDFVFIDDLHDGDHVAKEIDMLMPKMNAGGVIAGHDISNPPAIGEAFEQRGGVNYPEGHGLGVIELKDD